MGSAEEIEPTLVSGSINGLSVFLLKDVVVAFVKQRARNAAVSALTLGFLSLSAARTSSVIASRVV